VMMVTHICQRNILRRRFKKHGMSKHNNHLYSIQHDQDYLSLVDPVSSFRLTSLITRTI
jgi:hypothetical protein